MGFEVILTQILAMYSIVLVGVFVYKKGFLSNATIKQLSAFLLRIVTFFLITNSFITQFKIEDTHDLFISTLLSLLVTVVLIIIAHIIYGKRRKEDNFAVSFSNAAFMGMPLVNALFGSKAVLYIVPFFTIHIVAEWTYGVCILSGDDPKSKNHLLKTLAVNPAVLGTLAGILILLFQIPIPKFLQNSLASISSINSPLAMVILGTYIAQLKLSDLARYKEIVLNVFIRLIFMPAVILLIFYFLPKQYQHIYQVMIIMASTPTAIATSMFVATYNLDTKYASTIITVSTILSALTIPLWLIIAGWLHII